MGLSDSLIEQIGTMAAASPSAREAVAKLRAAFPGLSFLRVDAFDMKGEAPVRRLPLCNLFLVDARNHCWTVTTDPCAATAVVVADTA